MPVAEFEGFPETFLLRTTEAFKTLFGARN